MKIELNGKEYDPIISPQARIQSYIKDMERSIEFMKENCPSLVAGMRTSLNKAKIWFDDEVCVFESEATHV